MVELYDIHDDPEELQNLYPIQKNIANELLGAIKRKLEEVR